MPPIAERKFAAPKIHKATRTRKKARVATFGPSGCGKTFTNLLIADELNNLFGEEKDKGAPTDFVVIDTEHKSAELYSDEFSFDVIPVEAPYSPEHYIAAIETAEKEGYVVGMIDSISHEWMGEGGTTQIADEAGVRLGGNKWAGWSVATPRHNRFLERILASNMHWVVTMRAKTEWESKDGKPVKVGLGPIQRDGVDYEFDVVFLQNMDHSIRIEKSRARILEPGTNVELDQKTTRQMAKTIYEWLRIGVDPPKEEPKAETESEAAADEAEQNGGAEAEELKPATKAKITKAVKGLQESHGDYEKLDEGQTWDERVDKMVTEWYSVESRDQLAESQAQDLLSKLSRTQEKLDEQKAATADLA